MAAAASTLGSMVPFFIGRAGGEFFLLKRINRERYENIRDRFERQEFLAIMIPAMLPPPTPLKLFEFSAGVFEMKLVPFLLAIFCGKLVAVPGLLAAHHLVRPHAGALARHALHEHHSLVITVAVAGVFWLGFYAVRKIFDRRKGVSLPSEENL